MALERISFQDSGMGRENGSGGKLAQAKGAP